MTMRPAARALACAAAVAVLAFSACSDDYEQPASSGLSTTTTIPQETSSSSTAPSSTIASSSTSSPGAASGTAVLTRVQVAAQEGFDRVVFEFDDEQLPGYDIAYLEGPVVADGSGAEVEVEGAAVIGVRLTPASGADPDGDAVYTGPSRVTDDSENVTEVVRTGDFEATLSWAIGVAEPASFEVLLLSEPARVVIDISTAEA